MPAGCSASSRRFHSPETGCRSARPSNPIPVLLEPTGSSPGFRRPASCRICTCCTSVSVGRFRGAPPGVQRSFPYCAMIVPGFAGPAILAFRPVPCPQHRTPNAETARRGIGDVTTRRITPARTEPGLYGAALSGRNPNLIAAVLPWGRRCCPGRIVAGDNWFRAALDQGRVESEESGATIADRSGFDNRPPGMQPGNSRQRLSP